MEIRHKIHRDPRLDDLLGKRVLVTFKDGCTCAGLLYFNPKRGRYCMHEYKFTRVQDGVVMSGTGYAYISFAKSNMKGVEVSE